MRCAECERSITNADMWQLCNNPRAPTSRSLELLCWDCRLVPPPPARASRVPVAGLDVVAQAIEVVRAYRARA